MKCINIFYKLNRAYQKFRFNSSEHSLYVVNPLYTHLPPQA